MNNKNTMDHPFSTLPSRELSRIVDLLVGNSCDHALVLLDAGGHILSVSESFFRIFSLTEADVVGKNLTTLYPQGQQNPERMTGLISLALANGSAEEEENYQRGTHQVFCAKTVLFPVSGTTPPCFVGIIRDLTLLVASQEHLHTLLTVDELTGLNNRQHIFDLGVVEYRRWERYRSPLSMILCEVMTPSLSDDLKNGTLRDTADIIRQCLREVDAPARIHDVLYCILLFNTSLEGAAIVAERIRRAIRSTLYTMKTTEKISLNTVVNTANTQSSSFEDFYEQTFFALQKLRRQGDDALIVL